MPRRASTRVDLSALHRDIVTWYASAGRDLPWRDPECSPWGVFVSEIMAQQTPLSRVEPAWRRWLARWPTPAALAADPPGEAVRAWDRLGYPRRALRLHAAAVAMVALHEGQVPPDEDRLRALPGVGDYTAAAVACFGYGIPTVVVDTNVRRVLTRVLLGRAQGAPSLTAAERKLAARALPADPDLACRWNVAAMELGALVCAARGPACERCPVAARCAWRVAGSPPDDGPPRRRQEYAGTDRQARGALLAVLRQADGSLPVDEVLASWGPDLAADPAQADRALAGLLADGLVEFAAPGGATEGTGDLTAGRRLRLPG